jgi:hypothetical protein
MGSGRRRDLYSRRGSRLGGRRLGGGGG